MLQTHRPLFSSNTYKTCQFVKYSSYDCILLYFQYFLLCILHVLQENTIPTLELLLEVVTSWLESELSLTACKSSTVCSITQITVIHCVHTQSFTSSRITTEFKLKIISQ